LQPIGSSPCPASLGFIPCRVIITPGSDHAPCTKGTSGAFVAMEVFLVKTHPFYVAGMEIKSYWDFALSWISHGTEIKISLLSIYRGFILRITGSSGYSTANFIVR
jgi:hypothetical protein